MGDCEKIALMYSHCIVLYVILSEELELLILWAKLTIFINYLGAAQIVCLITAKCSNTTWPVTDQGRNSFALHAHRPSLFLWSIPLQLPLVFNDWRCSRAKITVWSDHHPDRETGLFQGNCSGADPWVILFFSHPAFYGSYLPIGHQLQHRRRQKNISTCSCRIHTGTFNNNAFALVKPVSAAITQAGYFVQQKYIAILLTVKCMWSTCNVMCI